jgi:hypothetical protein
LIDQGLTGVISFSAAPVRIAFFAGSAIALISGLYGAGMLALALLGFDLGQTGTKAIICAMLFVGGVQLMFSGLIGEYTVAIFNQVRGRPLVIERERVNFDPSLDQFAAQAETSVEAPQVE